MIVECDRCSTKYRVREDRLPASGGNIKCPGCAHVFFVAPPSPSGSAEPQIPSTTTPSQLVSTGVHQRVVASGGDTFNAATRQMDAATLAAGAGLLNKAPTTNLGPPGAAPEPKGPPAGGYPEDTSWKLKTSFGLVYDFPDTTSLRSWLTARDDLAGYELSADGDNFQELSAFPGIMTGALQQKLRGDEGPRATSFGLPTIGTSPDKVATGGSAPPPPRPSGSNRPLMLDPNLPSKPDVPARKAPGKASKTAGKAAAKGRGGSGRHKQTTPPRSRPSIPAPEPEKKNPFIAPAMVFVAGLFVLMALQISGVVDFKKMMGVEKKKPVPIVTTAPEEETPVAAPTKSAYSESAYAAPPRRREADDSVRPNREAQVAQMLQQAKSEMSKRDYDKAVLTLTSAKAVSPNDPEIYRLLDRVYTRQGNREAARVARDRFKELKDKGAGGSAPN